MPIVITPRAWYMAWNFGLAIVVVVLVSGLAWWFGPCIIARGLALWHEAPKGL